MKRRVLPKRRSRRSRAKPPAPEPFSIDFDGLNNRILSIPLPSGNYRNLQAGTAGQFFYLDSDGCRERLRAGASQYHASYV